MASQSRISPATRGLIKTVDHVSVLIADRWLQFFLIFYGIWVLTPFVAPVLMAIGATGAGQVIYAIYSVFCHQLPERSLFFFGTQPMYTLQQIAQVWPTTNAAVLRQFVGNAEMGWKIAWSDRMISVYGGVWLAGLIYVALGRRVPRVSLVAWLLLGVLPLGLDGVTHMINDVVAGTTGLGFRDINAWLAALTGDVLPQSFYAGDQLGSFNSWARWITGFLFSFTTVFALFPIIDSSMQNTAQAAERQLQRVLTYERE